MVSIEDQIMIAIEAWEADKAAIYEQLESQQQLIDAQQKLIETQQERINDLQNALEKLCKL